MTLSRPSPFGLILVFLAYAFVGCVPPSQCEGASCRPLETCVDGGQLVDGGCEASDAGTPVEQQDDPCAPNPCSEPGRSVCISGGAVFVCACDPGYVPSGEGCVVEPRCSGEHPGDSFEPDECLASARVVPSNGLPTEAHTLGEVADDVDWFRLSAVAGQAWRIDWSSSAAVLIAVDVFGADGVTLLASARPPAKGSLSFVAEADGEHFVRISGATPGMKGLYQVSIHNDGPDLHPSGADTTVEAVLDGEVTGRLQFAGDHDAVRLLVPARHHVALEARWVDGRASPLNLVVLDAQGAFLEQANGAVATTSLYFQTATVVLLRVQDALDQATGAWAISVADLGFDDHADRLPAATFLTGTTPTTGAAFERMGDVDVFAFQATAGHVYRFTCAGLLGTGCAVTVRDPAGNVSYQSDLSVEVRLEAPVGGLAVIEVLELGAPAAYSWSFEELGPDDHGDSPLSATPVSAPVLSLAAHFETRQDSDAFGFTGLPGHLYRAKCAPLTASACELSFVDGLGATWVSVQAPDEATVSITDAGTYFFVARLGAIHQPGDYTFTLEDLGPDDHGNSPATATAIAASSTAASAMLEGTRDVDVFTFTATPGALWSFECLQLWQCRVTLIDANGNQVAQGVGAAATSVPQTSTLWARIEGSLNNSGLSYQWKLSATPDDHGNTNATATPISAPPTATVNGTVDSPGDLDYFVLTPTWGSTYDLTCSPASGLTCQLTVRNQAGQLIDMDTGSVFAMSRFKAKAPNTTYYIEVKSFTAGQTGAYSLSLVEFAPDDHGDQPQWATAIPALGMAVTGAIEMTGDEDWFSITLPPGSYTATITGMSAEIYVVDQGWVGLGSGPAGNPMAFSAPSSGPAFLRVRWGGGGTTTKGTYSLLIQ